MKQTKCSLLFLSVLNLNTRKKRKKGKQSRNFCHKSSASTATQVTSRHRHSPVQFNTCYLTGQRSPRTAGTHPTPRGTICVTRGGSTSKANNEGRQESENRVILLDYKSSSVVLVIIKSQLFHSMHYSSVPCNLYSPYVHNRWINAVAQ